MRYISFVDFDILNETSFVFRFRILKNYKGNDILLEFKHRTMYYETILNYQSTLKFKLLDYTKFNYIKILTNWLRDSWIEKKKKSQTLL